jgi:negative regulator of sigma E activity
VNSQQIAGVIRRIIPIMTQYGFAMIGAARRADLMITLVRVDSTEKKRYLTELRPLRITD